MIMLINKLPRLRKIGGRTGFFASAILGGFAAVLVFTVIQMASTPLDIPPDNTAQALSVRKKVKQLVARVKAHRFGSAPALPPPENGETLNVSYGTDPLQKMDIYPSTTGQPSPAVIIVHGGGWHGGDKSAETWLGKKLADDGFTAYNVNYRLTSETQPGIPMQLNDMKAIIQWVQQYGNKYTTDTTRISMIGGSAGAHLVALAGTVVNNEAPGTISNVVSMSGPMDFTQVPAGTAKAQLKSVSTFLGCTITVNCSDQRLKEASPAHNVHTSTCPAFYIVNSINELVPVSQAHAMQNALQAADCRSTLKVMNGTRHGFGNYKTLESEIVSFLKS